MKSIVLIAVLCAIAVSALTCSESSCSSIGSQCSTECGDCNSAFITCSSADPSNATLICACYTTAVNCLAATKNPRCGSQDSHANCVSAFAGVYNCSCGTPYTSNTVYECSSGYCNSNTTTCMAYKSEGQSCSSDDECGSDSSIFGTQYTCEAGKCIKDIQLYPGDSCSNNNDCVLYGPYNVGCVNGICASQKVGADCVQICGPNLYCDDDNTCQNIIAIGGKCSTNATESGCASNGVCDNGVCVAPQSKNIGDSCADSLECKYPAYCSKKTMKCAAALSSPTCSNSTYCTDMNSDYAGCVCMDGSSTCQTDFNAALLKSYNDCSGPIQNLDACVSKNGCSEFPVAGGCVQTHCSNEYSCYFNCIVAAQDTCTDLKPTCQTTGAGEKNVVAFAMIALALFAYFL